MHNEIKSEADLCDAFAKVARENGFKVYPEVDTWDLVLVDSSGIQMGIQAKLRANLDVLHQAIRGRSKSVGPHYRGVLVKKPSKAFYAVAINLSIRVFTLKDCFSRRNRIVRRDIRYPIGTHYLFEHEKPLWLPPVIPDRRGGVPGPKQLTKWRVKAIELCMVLENRGYLTSRDFEYQGINPQLWVNKWICDSGQKLGRLKKYVPMEGAELPIEGWRDVAEQLRELYEDEKKGIEGNS